MRNRSAGRGGPVEEEEEEEEDDRQPEIYRVWQRKGGPVEERRHNEELGVVRGHRGREAAKKKKKKGGREGGRERKGAGGDGLTWTGRGVLYNEILHRVRQRAAGIRVQFSVRTSSS